MLPGQGWLERVVTLIALGGAAERDAELQDVHAGPEDRDRALDAAPLKPKNENENECGEGRDTVARIRAFRLLSPAGRLRRLGTVAAEALQNFALRDYRLTLVADSFNTIYRVSTDGESYLLRIGPEGRIHRVTEAVAESEWLSDLASRGLLVPRIILTNEGAPSVVVAVDHVPGVRECTLLSWRSGRSIARPVNTTDVADLATLSATLHEASPPRDSQPDGSLDGRDVLHFDIPDLLHQIGEPDRAIVQAAQKRARESLHKLWQRAPQTRD